MVKRVVIFVVLVLLGILIITNVILPQVTEALGIPSLATWTGLEGFLKMLPFVLVLGLLAIGIRSLFQESGD